MLKTRSDLDLSLEQSTGDKRTKATSATPEFYSEFEWLMYHMWLQPIKYAFKIPDTVFIKQRKMKTVGSGILRKEDTAYFLDNWYFTAAGGHILKKNRSNVTTARLQSKLTKGLNTNFEHVSATAYHYQLPDAQQEMSRGKLVLEHISTHDTSAFCQVLEQNVQFPRKPTTLSMKLPQIVQKFVYTKSSKNQMMRVTVKDGQVLDKIDRAYNIHDILDPKVSLQDKLGTFESLKGHASSRMMKQIS